MVTETFTLIPGIGCNVGDRIECGGHFGTIKYIGPVDGHHGIWLGVDWDEQERGKHNGTINGKHYFDTRYSTSGSFLRKEKVKSGRCLIEAIKARYGFKESETTAKKNREEMMKFQQQINAPFLEFVGFEKVANKQREFRFLEVVNVRLENINSAGSPYELGQLFPNIREIDLSKNLLSSWNEIFTICSQFKRLYWLNVSENILELPENLEKYTFPNISILVCGYMNLTWQDINKLSKIFPNVEELRVPFNNISDLSTPSDHNFIKLKYLDLEGNDIKLWSEIEKLSVIKELDHLTIENIGLNEICFKENSIPINEFKNLRNLNISHNTIVEWRSIAELNKLEKLEHLRFTKNPILESENFATREQIIIAKIKNLKSLSGRIILEEERRGAEYDYVKKYALIWLKLQTTEEKETFVLEHNRFLELIGKYGLPDESELVIQPNIINSSLINLNISYNGQIITKKLPPSILIQKIVMMVQKLFKLQDRPILTYVSGSKSHIRIDLIDDMKELGYYSIQEGDMIIVNMA
ncbi:unnamed protein product [Phaedon cochleariae]|uniref:Tubulin-specific chaperone E n=1 Tax=Phaedon cochleariae TaxID=80249 RepID=A0A9N9SGA7_PHACE|nr:unnamed protein product [Phaedon cochleariae]